MTWNNFKMYLYLTPLRFKGLMFRLPRYCFETLLIHHATTFESILLLYSAHPSNVVLTHTWQNRLYTEILHITEHKPRDKR